MLCIKGLHFLFLLASFGGDKNRVMIFGESAGAGSIACHITNKKSWGLFSSAAIESGSFSSWIAQPMSQAQAKFDKFLATSGCTDIPCLQNKTTDEIVSYAAQSVRGSLPFLAYAPAADGVEMTSHPWVTLADGQVADVPILHGTNRDETAIFDPIPKDATTTQLEKFWTTMPLFYNYIFSDSDITTLKNLYMQQTYPAVEGNTQEWWSGARSTGDVYFGCPARQTATTLAALQASGARKSNEYFYNFMHPRNGMDYVSHFSEVPYVFNWGYTGFRTHPADQDMADVMTAYWGNFIIDHNPSSHTVSYTSQLPAWEPFTTKEGVNVAHGIKQTECDFLLPIIDKTLRAAFA
jgi:para-nitrobenzyl esterase